jgi:NAD(P)-dependent dehydrogenase (short-subunit alcohol dehydrogenase family)
MRALVTGAAGGIGRAIVARLAAEGYDVIGVDLDELDVSDPEAWATAGLPRLDVACLNAGVVTGTAAIESLTDDVYRRTVGANVDGVVFGVRALLPLLPRGGKIVVTASLAGLTAVPSDPIYAGTKHFVIGFVRSIAPQLVERGISINAVCPGIVDTSMIDPSRAALEAVGFPLLAPADIAEAVARILASDGTGQAWIVQPGRAPEPYVFRGVPGPRVPGGEGVRPPL